jgi:hypothetical protein
MGGLLLQTSASAEQAKSAPTSSWHSRRFSGILIVFQRRTAQVWPVFSFLNFCACVLGVMVVGGFASPSEVECFAHFRLPWLSSMSITPPDGNFMTGWLAAGGSNQKR